MKWYAAQNKREEMSVLAIVETLAASGVAIWIAVYFQTLLPFAISVLVAPLLLLRTRDSTVLGIRWARRFDVYHQRMEHDTSLVMLSVISLVAGVVAVLGPFAIRIQATIAIMAKKPIIAVRAIPSNWWRLVGRIDSSVAPEPIPGWTRPPELVQSKTVPQLDQSKYFRYFWASRLVWGGVPDFIRVARAMEDRRATVLAYLGALLVLVPIAAIFGPALFYRWALKSSWWVYCPLLWVMSPATRWPPPAASEQEAQHRLIARVTDQTFVLIWSGVVVAACVAKIWLWQMRTAAAEWFNEQPVLVFFKPYIEPDSMPLWQWTAMANGVLAFAMYFAAKAAQHAEEDDEPWPPELVDRGFRTAMIVRRALTVYAIAVMVAITARRGVPPIGAVWPV